MTIKTKKQDEKAEKNAERQRKYRKNHENDRKRLDLMIDRDAAWALSRITQHYGVTKSDFLTKFLLEQDEQIRSTLETDAELEHYWDIKQL